MKLLTIGLSESQLDHLRTIKATHGISMSAFIRTLLKIDMERALIPEYAIIEEQQREITTATRRRVVIHRGPVSPERAALMAELNAILAKRKEKMEQAIVASPVRA